MKINHAKTNKVQNESGVVLVVVVCFVAMAAVLAVGLMTESGTQLKIAGKNVSLERAFYAAEGGAERAVSYIRHGGVVPTNLTGAIGNGTYSAYLLAMPDTAGTGGTHTVSGQININPNSSPQNEFLLMTTDGQAFDKDALQSSLQDYSGNAYLMRVKPKGASDQTIIVDGSSYTLEKNLAYNFSAPSFPVVLTNDSRNTNGLAMGNWWINIDGSGISFGDDPDPEGGQISFYSIYSIGTVEGMKKTVLLDGVHQESWAKYAMWYNSGPGAIWIVAGETFNGPVHANTFIYLKENPIFNALISTTKSRWGTGSNTNNVQFNAGYLWNAPAQSMASVNFSNFLPRAELVVTGLSSVTLSGTNMLISNARRGWTNNNVPVPSNGLVYVKYYSSSDKGNVNVGGTLDGRLTVVADYDINITNHIRYAANPATTNSDDALGLVAARNVYITMAAPTNLDLFAHIMAVGSATPTPTTDGSFEVENYSTRAFSGPINLYGGLVQYYRGAVGLADGSHGYKKNYTFDTRFLTSPPPDYPSVTNEYLWTGWRER